MDMRFDVAEAVELVLLQIKLLNGHIHNNFSNQ